MKRNTEEYNQLKDELFNLGIKKVYLTEPDRLSYEINDITTFEENNLKEFLSVAEKYGVKLWRGTCDEITYDNLKEKSNIIKILEEKSERFGIEIDKDLLLSGKIMVKNRVVDQSDGKRYVEGVNKPVSIEMLKKIALLKQQIEKIEQIEQINRIVPTITYNYITHEEKLDGINISIEGVEKLNKTDILELKKGGVTSITLPRGYRSKIDSYDIDTYIRILDALNEIVGDIDLKLPDEKRFGIVYRRICENIEYDVPAGYPSNEEEKRYREEVIDTCRNLKNGLLEKKCVCAGYATILKQALRLVNIESKAISGPIDKGIDKSVTEEDIINCGWTKTSEDYYSKGENYLKKTENGKFYDTTHAWNIVNLNGEWFQVDACWDRPDILKDRRPRNALTSDEYAYSKEKMDYNGGMSFDIEGAKCHRNATPKEMCIFLTQDAILNDLHGSLNDFGFDDVTILDMSEEDFNELSSISCDSISFSEEDVKNVKKEILKKHPILGEYKKTRAGNEILRILKIGLDEDDILKYGETMTFKNGVTFEEIRREINLKRMEAKKDLEVATLEEKNPISDIEKSDCIRLSRVDEATKNTKDSWISEQNNEKNINEQTERG